MSSVHFLPRRAVRLRSWLALLCLLAAFTAGAQEKIYTVKRNDTLSGIARQYGLSVAQIADRNSLSRQTHVHVGQRLIIPGKTLPQKSAPKAPAAPTLPATIQSALARAPVKTARWKHIVIHHSGVDTGTMKGMDDYHRKVRHMEHGLAYHFVIGNGNGMGDGEIAVSRRWTQQLDGGHLRSEQQNKIALGICLVGNFEKKKPTDKQMRSLENLTRALLKRCNLSGGTVRTHQQINVISTRCPGRYFPAKNFLTGLREKK